MGNLRFDVVLVGAVHACVLDVAVVDAQVEALADEHLGQFDQGLSRRSSVPALKDRPSRATLRFSWAAMMSKAFCTW